MQHDQIAGTSLEPLLPPYDGNISMGNTVNCRTQW
jgi:hypothetical protein